VLVPLKPPLWSATKSSSHDETQSSCRLTLCALYRSLQGRTRSCIHSQESVVSVRTRPRPNAVVSCAIIVRNTPESLLASLQLLPRVACDELHMKPQLNMDLYRAYLHPPCANITACTYFNARFTSTTKP